MQSSEDQRRRQRNPPSPSPPAGSLLALFGHQDDVSSSSWSARRTPTMQPRWPALGTTPGRRLNLTAASGAPDESVGGSLSHGPLASSATRQTQKSAMVRRLVNSGHRQKAENSVLRSAENEHGIQSPLMDSNRLKLSERGHSGGDPSDSSSSSSTLLSETRKGGAVDRNRYVPPPRFNDRQLEFLGQESSDSEYEAESDSDGKSVDPSSSPRKRKGRVAAPPNPKKPSTHDSPLTHRLANKTKKRATLLHIGAARKRPDPNGDDPALASHERTNGSSGITSNRPPRSRQGGLDQVGVDSGTGTDMSFPCSDDESTSSSDAGMWESLGGFIDDMSGNKPVHHSTVKFGMEVIEDEYRRVRDRKVRPSSLSKTVLRRRSRSLAQVKAEICKLVRVELRTRSLPSLYIRVEDPCNVNLAKRTEEREARADDEVSLAARLAKRRDRLVKKAEKLEKRIESLEEELHQAPTDVYGIHPDLQRDVPSGRDGARGIPRGKFHPVKFRPAPVGTADMFLGSLFPSSNE